MLLTPAHGIGAGGSLSSQSDSSIERVPEEPKLKGETLSWKMKNKIKQNKKNNNKRTVIYTLYFIFYLFKRNCVVKVYFLSLYEISFIYPPICTLTEYRYLIIVVLYKIDQVRRYNTTFIGFSHSELCSKFSTLILDWLNRA